MSKRKAPPAGYWLDLREPDLWYEVIVTNGTLSGMKYKRYGPGYPSPSTPDYWPLTWTCFPWKDQNDYIFFTNKQSLLAAIFDPTAQAEFAKGL